MSNPTVEIVLGALNVFQTLCLAVMADRSRRVRGQLDRPPRRAPQQRRPPPE